VLSHELDEQTVQSFSAVWSLSLTAHAPISALSLLFRSSLSLMVAAPNFVLYAAQMSQKIDLDASMALTQMSSL